MNDRSTSNNGRRAKAGAGARKRPAVLCILDGWGYREETADNAIAMAPTPVWDEMLRDCPMTLLDTAGAAVGLPDGQMGNSEVGHMNIGGGRVVLQDLPRIDEAISNGALARNPVFAGLKEAVAAAGGRCHIMGLLSPGGVHSHQDHMAYLGRQLAEAGVPVVFHAFLDGRDTPPQSAADYLKRFRNAVGGLDNVTIGTLSGRYYAMDRDKRWERTEQAFRALAEGEGLAAETVIEGLDAAYARGESDEFVQPTVIGGYTGIEDGDAVLMANFRADRARQILTALVEPDFREFTRPHLPALSAKVGMVEYSSELSRHLESLFPPESVADCLGEVAAAAGLHQLRVAETEKYAHVTFFLNGGREEPFDGEDRILIPSPKVATYDLQPEMSAPEVTDAVVGAIDSGQYDLVIVNYANPDMVGHTGKLDAALEAVRVIDGCLGRLRQAVLESAGAMLITADHGNIEMMSDPASGGPHTAHTIGKVPLVLVSGADGLAAGDGLEHLADARLADIAPTLLAILGLEQPPAMSGRNLLELAPRTAERGARAHVSA